MSTLEVKVIEIGDEDVRSHPNADRLDLVMVGGWQCVAQAAAFGPGDKAVYIPIDSILPHEIESMIFGPESKVKLSKSRVKTIKLRGAISQGLLVKPTQVGLPSGIKIGSNVMSDLGITKWEPPAKGQASLAGGGGHKRIAHPNFAKYTKLENIKNYMKLFEDGEEVIVTEKIHGCFNYRSRILLSNGKIQSIGEIVKNKMNVEVLGMNNNGEVVPTKITNWFKNGSTKKWLKIHYSNSYKKLSNKYFTITCTPNHKLYDANIKEFKNAETFKKGDMLLMTRQSLKPTNIQEQILIGKMLGDGSVDKTKKSILFSHKKEHEEYIDYTSSCLGSLIGNKQKDTVSGYGTDMCRIRTKASFFTEELFSDWYLDKDKQVPKGIKLTPISLAFWYMDDGSLTHDKKQDDRADFATCNFNEESQDSLVEALDQLDIKASKKKNDYWRIVLNAKEADKLFLMIMPYIPKIMQYKLPEKYRGYEPIMFKTECQNEEPFTSKQSIISITEIEESQVKYDIETETHNFFVNHILVHNSNFRAGYVPYDANSFWKKVKKFFRATPKYEFVYGSHNVQLQDKFLYNGYYKKNVYAETVIAHDLKNVLKDGEVIYGEIYGDGIQKNYKYGCAEGEHKLVAFDLMKNGEYKTSVNFFNWCSERNIPRVKALYKGPFDYEKIKTLLTGNSVMHPEQKIIEGGVVKPAAGNEQSYKGRKALKIINDEYLLKDNSDFH